MRISRKTLIILMSIIMAWSMVFVPYGSAASVVKAVPDNGSLKETLKASKTPKKLAIAKKPAPTKSPSSKITVPFVNSVNPKVSKVPIPTLSVKIPTITSDGSNGTWTTPRPINTQTTSTRTPVVQPTEAPQEPAWKSPFPIIANLITIYYKKSSPYSQAFIHAHPVSLPWTLMPGTMMMDSVYPGYAMAVLNASVWNSVEAIIFDGGWVAPKEGKFLLSPGKYTIENNTLYQGEPQVASITPVPVINATPTAVPTAVPAATPNNQLTIYYKLGVFTKPFAHFRPYNSNWSVPPGLAMIPSEFTGYSRATLDLGPANGADVVFNDNGVRWDSNGGQNYKFNAGIYTFEMSNDGSVILSGTPHVLPSTPAPIYTPIPSPTHGGGKVVTPSENPTITNFPTKTPLPTLDPTATPSPTATVTPVNAPTPKVSPISKGSTEIPQGTSQPVGTDAVKVYYKSGWLKTYTHYRVNGGAWTNLPGLPMQDGDVSGYCMTTIYVPQGNTLEVAFNDGANGWDSRNGLNYSFTAGTYQVKGGQIFSGAPSSSSLVKLTGSQPFTWDNASVYFVIPDRFVDGDPTNNHSYGRELNLQGVSTSDYKSQPGTFHGGDLKGLTKKLNDGYFSKLGVNAIWITAPYEQIHGWIGGGDPSMNEGFRHYAYHGYWVLDYTEVDQNMGTREDLRTLIDTAHSQGVRIIFDVVMNHAGYATMKDMDEFGFGELSWNWKDYYYNKPWNEAYWKTYNSYIQYNSADRWAKYWGPQWIRALMPGYPKPGSDSDDVLKTLDGLSDFRTESNEEVTLPPILITKWSPAKLATERAELDQFFQVSGKPRTPRNHIVKWLTDWVREFGVDGFRIDTAKNVELDAWKTLKEQSVSALREWKEKNPSKKLDDLDFWMVAEAYGHGFYKDDYYYNGFDAVINFDFRKAVENQSNLENMFSSYASKLNSDPSFNVLNYISSHDDAMFDRNNLYYAADALLLSPGAAQIFYGDESGRKASQAPWTQGLRSDMNWDTTDQNLLAHWQKIGTFRNRHISIGAGEHTKLSSSPYIFMRKYEKNGVNDRVIVAMNVSGVVSIDVSSAFPNGSQVRDAYTGRTTTVSGGKIVLQADPKGIMLLEAVISQ